MTFLLFNTLLALAWLALTGTFTPGNFLIGFVLGYSLLWLTQRLMAPSQYFTKVPQVLVFVVFFLKELIQASFRMALMVVQPRPNIRPAIVAIPLDAQSDAEITLLANLITLTPSSLFLDISEDRCVMYVHTIFVDDVDLFRHRIKRGFERRIMEVFQ